MYVCALLLVVLPARHECAGLYHRKLDTVHIGILLHHLSWSLRKLVSHKLLVLVEPLTLTPK